MALIRLETMIHMPGITQMMLKTTKYALTPMTLAT